MNFCHLVRRELILKAVRLNRMYQLQQPENADVKSSDGGGIIQLPQ